MTAVSCSTPGCAAVFELEIPDDLPEVYRKILEGVRVCPACVEQSEREDERREHEQAVRERAEVVRKRRAASGIPEELQSITWDRLREHPEAIEAARAWARGDLTGLFLAGTVGVGKTWIAATAAWELSERRPVRWVDTAELLSRLNRSFGDPLREDAVLALSNAESSALVLDDIGMARATEHAALELYRAIDNREKAGTQLLVTSNLTLPQLRDKFPHGQAIVSRLARHCEALLLEGPDRRLIAAHEQRRELA